MTGPGCGSPCGRGALFGQADAADQGGESWVGAERPSVIDLIGIAIVLWGFVRALFGFVRAEAHLFSYADAGVGRMHRVRLELGTYILLGIEFMIASDIIHTVITRELGALAFVSALVAIRTAISFFLGRELAEVRRDDAA